MLRWTRVVGGLALGAMALLNTGGAPPDDALVKTAAAPVASGRRTVVVVSILPGDLEQARSAVTGVLADLGPDDACLVIGADGRTVLPWTRKDVEVPPWQLGGVEPVPIEEAVRRGREAVLASSGGNTAHVVLVASSSTFLRSALDGLASDLQRDRIGLTLLPVGPLSEGLSLVWDVRERGGHLGTGVTFEASPVDARARAAREGRLVLLVQLSGNFDRVPET